MKEDILEQLVDDWLQALGYFTRHNIKFKPRADHPEFESQQDSVPSDIDVIAINPLKQGPERVIVVTCKSWQEGFNARTNISKIEENKKQSGREAWRGFRELARPKWSEAFMKAVEDATGTRTFQYLIAVTSLKGDKTLWEKHSTFSAALGGNRIGIVTLTEMANEVTSKLTTTVAASAFGRTLQLLKAAGVLDTARPTRA
jgi:hypothetical protein